MWDKINLMFPEETVPTVDGQELSAKELECSDIQEIGYIQDYKAREMVVRRERLSWRPDGTFIREPLYDVYDSNPYAGGPGLGCYGQKMLNDWKKEHWGQTINGFDYANGNSISAIWDSVMQKNNCTFFYNQNQNLADNIDNAQEHGVEESIIQNIIYTAMIHMFYSYLVTVNLYPELTKMQLQSAASFYNNYFKSVPFDEKMLTNKYYELLSEHLLDKNGPIRNKMSDLNIANWLVKLETFENL